MINNKTFDNDNVTYNYQQSMSYSDSNMGGCQCNPCETVCPPICECPQNKVCHRVMNYTVPHLIPINTTVVNHHVYNHTYTPVFSTSYVDEVENTYNRCC